MPGENNGLSVEELTQKIADLEAKNVGLVEEIKGDRQKKNDEIETLKTSLIEATKANATKQEPGDIATVVATLVEQKLGERDASTAQSNKVAAVEKFVSEHKEFSPENDVTGKRREALVTALDRFNTSGLSTVQDFYAVIRDAATLLGVNTIPQTSSEVANPYSSTTRTSITPQTSDTGDVDAAEKRLIEKNGWTKEKYLTMKAKDPAFMANLVRLMQTNY